MVYSFSSRTSLRSLGTFMVPRSHRPRATHGLAYVYFGYWVSRPRKMDYKCRFLPAGAADAGRLGKELSRIRK